MITSIQTALCTLPSALYTCTEVTESALHRKIDSGNVARPKTFSQNSGSKSRFLVTNEVFNNVPYADIGAQEEAKEAKDEYEDILENSGPGALLSLGHDIDHSWGHQS